MKWRHSMALSPFLENLETTEMSKSFKMVVLTAMLNRNLPARFDLVAGLGG